jgi:hypothetical protein
MSIDGASSEDEYAQYKIRSQTYVPCIAIGKEEIVANTNGKVSRSILRASQLVDCNN